MTMSAKNVGAQLLRTIALCAAVLVSGMATAAWPDRPVKLLIGFGAGGGADTLGRLVAKALEQELGQPVVAENMPGGGGVVMATTLARAKPDGYTIGIAVNSTFDFLPWLGSVAFKAEDFDYLATVTELQNALMARGDAPFSNWKEMVEYGRTHGLTYGSSSPMTIKYAETMSEREGIRVRVVPMKGGREILNNIMGSHVDIGWSAGVHQPYIGDDKVKIIASLNDDRLESTPDIPSITEMGYDGYTGYFMFAAPKGIPADILAKLTAALSKAARSPDVAELAVKRMGFPNVVLGPEELHKFIMEKSAINKRLYADK